MTLWPTCFLFFCITWVEVLGNTEIINFSVEESSAVTSPFTHNWPVLSPTVSSLQTNGTSAPLGTVIPQAVCPQLDKWSSTSGGACPHELWLLLELGDDKWKTYPKFTLRVSWPAFHPTDISLKVFDPSALSTTRQTSSTTQKTRQKYARIQFIHAGVLTPTSQPLDDVSRYHVPIIVVLEPLHFGVLPSSVIPVVFSIILAIALGIPLSSRINAYLRPIVQQAKHEAKMQSKEL